MDLTERRVLRQSIVNCTSCGLSSPPFVTPVPFRGDAPCDLLVVGEAPGRQENTDGKPFVGPAGILAEQWVNVATLGLDVCVAWCNAVSCYPNRTPNDLEVAACRGNLMAQIRATRPRQLLLLGGVALSAWWKDLRVGDAKGWYWRAIVDDWKLDGRDAPPPWAVTTWHPAAVLRNDSLQQDVNQHLLVLRNMLKMRPWDRPVCWNCVLCGKRIDDDAGDVWVGPSTDRVGVDVTRLVADSGLGFCANHWAFRTKTDGGVGRATKPKTRTKKKEPTDDNQGTLL